MLSLRARSGQPELSVRSVGGPETHLFSNSPMPLTRFCVYCTISLKRNAHAPADTSAPRDLASGRS